MFRLKFRQAGPQIPLAAKRGERPPLPLRLRLLCVGGSQGSVEAGSDAERDQDRLLPGRAELSPGERWQKELYRHIDECDLFLLFWSQAAKDSKWVIKEAEYALARQTGDEAGEPDIIPVPLQGPPPVLPPDSLKDIHFDDRIQYFIAAS